MRLLRAALTALAASGLLVTALAPAAPAREPDPATERYRPHVHFSPEKNWMNDPNGMVFHEGTWHLFFQHNPSGTRWGNMSWGHATSPDLFHWEQQPLAIPQTFDDAGNPVEDIFSGSVVSDETNSSGLGTAANPPLVALYTSAYTSHHPTLAGRQAQSLAYSLDNGQTWTKYSGNPVLDRGSANFRDPKVFRYDGPAGSYWVMVAVEAVDHKVVLYKSENLVDWTYLSEFGNANATGGIWECPDLFPLPVDGDPDNEKWVLVVNLNPGAVAGGSGGQYFVGEFDGTTFTSESTVGRAEPPAGVDLGSFDDGTFGGWTVANEPGNAQQGPWGSGPAAGTLPGQNVVSGHAGAGLVNGFHGGDWPVGTMESEPFTIERDFLNFLVGGGRHPHVPGARLDNAPPAGTLLFEGFEYAAGGVADHGWELTGDFAPERNPSTAGGEYYLGEKRLNTWEGGPRGDDNQGTLTSPAFPLDGDHVSFLLGGGRRTDGSLQAELLVDGEVVRSTTGPESGALNWKTWDVTDYAGRTARLRLVDRATGGWGHLTLDHVVVGDEPARVRSDETSVNLVVDGEVVRTATGSNSESLDWESWDVRDLVGESATIRLVDNNRSGWGHLLADQFMAADAPARKGLTSYDWLDWGRDYYAAVSFSGVPDGRRVMLGWMNNWDYANDIPTSTWRSSMALPREVELVSTPQGPRLAQQVVDEIAPLRSPRDRWSAKKRTITGTTTLPVTGDVVQVDARIRLGSADAAGLSVLGGSESATRIGYDARRGELLVDRTDSGDTDFHPAFPSVERAPVALENGVLTIRVYVDRASVEVFTADGRTTITDQVFPEVGADDIGLWAEGGTAHLERLTVTPLERSMWADGKHRSRP
ncbi:levanase [Nocardioides thalensis]|uniref:Levanase n=1 Tax=Nocardioides thalensis TaxID=1914755 RepID=A0A853BZW8_9ACTN|nr:glycoside hydrolase family 32 protein [Nocardioides thalensis]NYI99672.1 levanase [Nocardioides thalensis]